jgi:hypothetical protein
MSEPVKVYALSAYDDCGRFSPRMAELHTLPDPDSRTGYILAADHDRVVQELRADVEKWKAKAVEIDEIYQQLQDILQETRKTNRAESLANARSSGLVLRERDTLRAEVDDLSALVRQLVHSLRKSAPGNELSEKALDYLKRKGLQGSPLRAALAGGKEGE